MAVVRRCGDGESAQHGVGQRVIVRTGLGKGELFEFWSNAGAVFLRSCQKEEQQGEGFVLFDSSSGGFVMLQQAVKHPVPLMKPFVPAAFCKAAAAGVKLRRCGGEKFLPARRKSFQIK